MMVDTPTSPVLAEALAYATRGWHVVPVIPGQKRPAWDRWTERATTDLQLIEQWYTVNDDHGLGIATGPASGIWVLDIDPAHGGDDSLADLTHQYGPLPDTVEAVTGGGGRHILFAWPGWNPGTNAGRLGPGIDIRAEGGFIVAPPSVHPNGRKYAWELSADPADTRVVSAPDWLLDLCRPIERPLAPPRLSSSPRRTDRHLPEWADMLTTDGATYAGTRTNRTNGRTYQLWCRPGKTPNEGTSATLGYSDADTLKVFTSNWPGLPEDTYTRFGYYAHTRYGGNHERAARELQRLTEQDDLRALAIPATVEYPTDTLTTSAPEPDDLARFCIDWPTFYANDHTAEQWLAWPVIASGRGHALYAPAKAGKSSVLLHIAATIATGQPLFGRPPQPPQHVLYCDYEMSEADLRERLDELGYDEHTDLSHLHYALLPAIAPLDTPDGADTLIRLAEYHHAAVTIIDTFGRAVKGEENDADVVRAFYRLVGSPLKARGIATLRTDHSGKNLDAGQRGSSAKNDDVDVVWKLTRTERGVRLQRTHSRMSWVPEKVDLIRVANAEGDVRWTTTSTPDYCPGTRELAHTLDVLGLAIDASKREALTALRAQGEKVRDKRVTDALRWRREEHREPVDDDRAPLAKTPAPPLAAPVAGTETSETENPRSDPTAPRRAPAGTTPPAQTGTTTGDVVTVVPSAPKLTAEDLI